MHDVLIYPYQRPRDDAEWRDWLARGSSFGQLTSAAGEGGWPVVVPAHFVLRRRGGTDEVLVHLAAHNPLFAAVERDDRVVLTVVGDDAFVPGGWRVAPDEDPRVGVPTSYFTAVQLRCRARVVEDSSAKAELLSEQLAHFEPAGSYLEPAADGLHADLLPDIRGLHLSVVEVRVKLTYDDHRTVAAQHSISDRLEQRAEGQDLGAAAQQRRRAATRAEPTSTTS